MPIKAPKHPNTLPYANIDILQRAEAYHQLGFYEHAILALACFFLIGVLIERRRDIEGMVWYNNLPPAFPIIPQNAHVFFCLTKMTMEM